MAKVITLFPEGGAGRSYTFTFPDGATLTLAVPEGDNLTVAQAVFMLEDAKFGILAVGRGD